LNQDKGIAENYYRLAASRGNRAAYESLKHMYDEIRPDDQKFQIYN
jgi:TPR repeat protein